MWFSLLHFSYLQLGENSEFLWRLSKAIYLGAVAAEVGGSLTSGSPDSANNNMMLRSDDAACANAKRALIEEAVECGRRAVESNEMSSEAHKWYAIAVGSRGEFVSIREKILDGFEFKRHVDRAAELAPQDHTIQHLLGRSVAPLILLEHHCPFLHLFQILLRGRRVVLVGEEDGRDSLRRAPHRFHGGAS